MAGPSPLARGKLLASVTHSSPIGTIPARAGETSRPACCRCPAWDHPRSRGGNEKYDGPTKERWGPSPLARGKHMPPIHCASGPGTIPARAGETGRQSGDSRCRRDHPRSRGGNRQARIISNACEGPSPLARGKLIQSDMHCWLLGTIPARAGETDALYRHPFSHRDHPRSRGGNSRTQAPDRK